jgi:hypothetical protein
MLWGSFGRRFRAREDRRMGHRARSAGRLTRDEGARVSNFRHRLARRIGKRNLPFLAAVVALALVVIVLMIYSPKTESGNGRRAPSVVTTE